MTKIKSNTHLIMIVLAAFGLGMLTLSLLKPQEASTDHSHAPAAESHTEYTCSMHPQIRLPEFGQCPICFMDLIPVEDGGASSDPNKITMSHSAMQLAEIRTTPVIRADSEKEITLQGRIEYDETRIRQISAWLPGRIDRKFVDYTGIEINQGEHLVDIYSPDLINAQENLLQALESRERSKNASLPVIRETSEATYKDARDRLLLLGLQENQVRLLERTRKINDQITIYSPTSGIVIEKHIKQGAYVQTGTPLYTIADLESVWLMADAYESDLPWLRYGQNVSFEVRAFPGKTFEGRVSFIAPTVDPKSRTIKIRINVENIDLELKPGMFATANVSTQISHSGQTIESDLADKWICPMHRGIVMGTKGACTICGMDLVHASTLRNASNQTSGESAPLLIPRSAPLITGKRAVAYVRVPDSEEPTFQYREIVLGPRVESQYVVLEGLEEGEEVVVNGTFKIDGSRQIMAQPSMMSMEGQQSEDTPKVDQAFREGLASIQQTYYDANVALADDKLAGSYFITMASQLDRVDTKSLDTKSLDTWNRFARDLKKVLDSAAKDDIEAQREVLHDISEQIIATLKTFGAPKPAHLFHCPMGPGEDGSFWLQPEAEMANPYMGHRMLRCGTEEGQLKEMAP